MEMRNMTYFIRFIFTGVFLFAVLVAPPVLAMEFTWRGVITQTNVLSVSPLVPVGGEISGTFTVNIDQPDVLPDDPVRGLYQMIGLVNMTYGPHTVTATPGSAWENFYISVIDTTPSNGIFSEDLYQVHTEQLGVAPGPVGKYELFLANGTKTLFSTDGLEGLPNALALGIFGDLLGMGTGRVIADGKTYEFIFNVTAMEEKNRCPVPSLDRTLVASGLAKEFEDSAPATPAWSLEFPAVRERLWDTMHQLQTNVFLATNVMLELTSGFRPKEYQEHFYNIKRHGISSTARFGTILRWPSRARN
jgi:hypothetical protein